MRVKPLSWDSAFFNLKIGELQLEQNADTVDAQDEFDLIYVKSSEEIPLVFAPYNCEYSEVKVVFEKKGIVGNSDPSPHISDVSEVEFKLEQLYQLAFESGRYSRFAMDPQFSTAHFKKLYTAWIDNSINKTFAEGFLVYHVAKDIRGFVTYQIKDNQATIGLIATSPEHQGQGIGTHLIKGVESQLATKGISSLQIPTQLKNEGACNFYKKLGYSPVETTYLKHYWRDPV